MKIAPMGDVKNNFSKYLVDCEAEPVFVTRNGRVTAVLEHINDEDIEDYLLGRSARFRGMLNRVKHEKGGVSLAAYRKKRGI